MKLVKIEKKKYKKKKKKIPWRGDEVEVE